MQHFPFIEYMVVKRRSLYSYLISTCEITEAVSSNGYQLI